MKIWILEKKLSDGSPVYDVAIGGSEDRISCENQKQAELLAEKLKEVIDANSLAQVSTEYNY
jgi:hypothetical protein